MNTDNSHPVLGYISENCENCPRAMVLMATRSLLDRCPESVRAMLGVASTQDRARALADDSRSLLIVKAETIRRRGAIGVVVIFALLGLVLVILGLTMCVG